MNNSCKFCQTNNVDHQGDPIWLDEDKDWEIRILYRRQRFILSIMNWSGYENFNQEIKYCPICGKKLGECK